MLKACAFDLGNTLVNDAELLEKATADMGAWLEEGGFLPSAASFCATYLRVNRADHRPFISHTYGEREWFRDALQELGVRGLEPEAALSRYRRLLEGRLRVDPTVIDALDWLKGENLRLALLTNESSARVRSFLRLTGLVGRFEAVLISEEVGVEKPDPAFFRRALKELAVQPNELAMIGDNEVADGACKELGVPFVLLTQYKRSGWGWETGCPYPPDYVLPRLDRASLAEMLHTFGHPDRVAVHTRSQRFSGGAQ